MKLYIFTISFIFIFSIQGHAQETENKEEEKSENQDKKKKQSVEGNNGLTSSDKETLTVTEDSEGLLSFQWGDKTINYKKEESNQPLPPILFSVGFNFDFLDGIKANDLYADVSVDLPLIFLKKNGDNYPTSLSLLERFGIEFGVFQRRTISHLDTLQETFQVLETETQQVEDEVTFNHYRTIHYAKTASEKSVENLGLFFQPKYAIINVGDYEGKGDNSGFNLISHFEWLRSKYKSSLKRTISIDSASNIGETPDNWDHSLGYSRAAPSLEEKSAYDEYNVNIGFGAELFFSRPAGSFKLKTIFGKTKTKITETDDNGLQRMDRIMNNFYLIQSEVMENNILGLKLGVEVRGFFDKNDNDSDLDRNTPQFTVYLAKQFSLAKIGDLFTPN